MSFIGRVLKSVLRELKGKEEEEVMMARGEEVVWEEI